MGRYDKKKESDDMNPDMAAGGERERRQGASGWRPCQVKCAKLAVVGCRARRLTTDD
jgi:hypothetical protein